MLRMVKRLIALSLGTQRAQLEQRTGRTWPRPLLLRPLVEKVSYPARTDILHISQQAMQPCNSSRHPPAATGVIDSVPGSGWMEMDGDGWDSLTYSPSS
jgi:hypothetical protein